ncbi:hypothetical protein PLESTB_001104000 [Pleodorina starrii]|uniref:Uncharacterized protein n=1 Tax=Pleodorina starrii TaxID=330485 RepID=A0A9W6F5F2_9CHLO|nr:hypothetical protein PLESTM_001338900 [Pleodorina starrii]GLC56430.1 hypothetical protein PLESTB_001104000 [Pleodorina starrii]GLC68930.1 hypothetical protein PLESTF_000760200 [Pleodorina starrii]
MQHALLGRNSSVGAHRNGRKLSGDCGPSIRSCWLAQLSRRPAHGYAYQSLGMHRTHRMELHATATQWQVDLEEAVEEDFYALLGVSPLADAKEIKRAYYSMMRTCHPDRSADIEANDFCVLLNEVYETLTDPTRRALYDELAGFSAESVNPFLDDRYPRDRVFVDEFSCIGCRNCNHVCPKTFGMEEEYGRARAMQQDVDSEAKLQEAIDTCPVSCIHWVSGPQLSLLETAMARMERLPVWTMMGGAGANKDVFTEASLAWTRRQSDIRRRVQAATASTTTGWSFWNNAVNFGGATGSRLYRDATQARQKQQQQQQQEGSAAGAGDRESRGVADLAARAARAARTWRRYQEVAAASRRERMVLSSTSSASSMDE